MRNTADVTGKPFAVKLQSILGGSVVKPLVAFYQWKEGKVLFFCSVPDTTRDKLINYIFMNNPRGWKAITGFHSHITSISTRIYKKIRPASDARVMCFLGTCNGLENLQFFHSVARRREERGWVCFIRPRYSYSCTSKNLRSI
jgi:hypothetical protein